MFRDHREHDAPVIRILRECPVVPLLRNRHFNRFPAEREQMGLDFLHVHKPKVQIIFDIRIKNGFHYHTLMGRRRNPDGIRRNALSNPRGLVQPGSWNRRSQDLRRTQMV